MRAFSWPLAFAVSLGVLLPAALAGNLRSMDDSVLSKFNDEDVRLMQQAMDTALDSTDDGKKVEWKNDKTESRGAVSPSAGSKEGCRVLRIENWHGESVDRAKFQFCKVDGKWKATS
jgi:surface antigen